MPRPGLTLIELLVTMTIIALVSAAILGTASAALQAGRRDRTKSLITKINGLLLERWDSYADRRVEIDSDILNAIDLWANAPGLTPTQQAERYAARGQMLADARLLGLRELMKMEMPDRWSDIINQGLQNNAPLNAPTVLETAPPLTRAYYQQLWNMQQAGKSVEEIRENQSAECLYMIIMMATGDGEARTLFTSQDFGDTDGDGAPEFLDGWGRPISYIRWPIGFVFASAVMTNDPDQDHDPFDVFRRDSPSVVPPLAPQVSLYPAQLQLAVQGMRNRNQVTPVAGKQLLAIRLVPLIFSIGPDEDSDVNSSPESTTELDPYLDKYGGSGNTQLGATFDQEGDGDGWKDNITNHLNEY